MKIARRILALVIVAMLVVTLLAACGKKGDDASSNPAAGVGYTEGTTPEQLALFGDLKGTKLRVADDANMLEWEKVFYEQFEETTGMMVEIEPMSGTELASKISQAVAAGDKRNYFDVGSTGSSTILNVIYSNLAIPLDNYVYYDDPVWKYDPVADFNSLDLFKIDGHYWVAPCHGFLENFIFYNKTYFQEVGAPDPYDEYYLKDNWTFDTFMDTCAAVTKKNSDGEVETYAWATWNYFTFCAAAGNDMIKQDDMGQWQIIFDQPNGIAGLDVFYQSIVNKWVLVGDSGYEHFVDRRVAMLIEQPSSAIAYTNIYERSSDEIGIVPFPKMDANQEKYICPMIPSGYYIPACAQNQKGAAAYLYYHRLGEMNRDNSELGKANLLKGMLNQESQDRRAEYLAKCDFSVSFVDGLNGWYSGTRDTFLDVMRKDKLNPATAVDTMKGLMADALRRTVF